MLINRSSLKIRNKFDSFRKNSNPKRCRPITWVWKCIPKSWRRASKWLTHANGTIKSSIAKSKKYRFVPMHKAMWTTSILDIRRGSHRSQGLANIHHSVVQMAQRSTLNRSRVGSRITFCSILSSRHHKGECRSFANSSWKVNVRSSCSETRN